MIVILRKFVEGNLPPIGRARLLERCLHFTSMSLEDTDFADT